MSLELLNTSAPRGVRTGSTGFCTVGMTAGVSPALEERLTLLSGYRWLVPPGENGTQNNPVAYSHWRLMAGDRMLSILSRVCDAGFDYSRRSNRFAHHVVIKSKEQAEPGPAWVMMQPGVMRTSWAGEPMVFPEGPDIPQGHSSPHVCAAWKSAAGDAGWAGVLAETFARDPSRVAWIIYPPGMEVLPLVDEAIALLQPSLRWQVTFCTYFTDLPAGLDCAWRFCPVGSRAAVDAARQQGAGLLIDLTQPLPPAPENAYTQAARDGSAIAYESYSAPKTAASELGGLPDPMRHTVEPPFDPAKPGALREYLKATESPAAATHEVGRQARNGGHEPPVFPTLHDTAEPPTSSRAFWILAVAWPLIVGGGAVAYFHHTRSSASSSLVSEAIAQPAPQTTTQPAGDTNVIPITAQPAATQTSPLTIDDRDRTIAQLRNSIAEMKDDLAAARIRAQGGVAAQTELETLKTEYAVLQKKLAAAPATQPAPAIVDHTVELFRDEVELWPGDGNGPPDLVQLESYKPSETLLVERSAGQIALKSAIFSAAGGAPAPPVEIAIITIDGQRVVLKWIAVNRSAVSAPIRTWLGLSRLTVSRQGHIVGLARFVSMRSAEINVDHEVPASLLPDLRSKEALQHIGLAAPVTMPQGWTAKQTDGQTVTFSNSTSAGAAFDAQLTITPEGEVQVQTTYSIALYRQIQTSLDPAAMAPAKTAAKDAATALRALPALSVLVVNRDNGLALVNIKIKRGE